MSKWYRFNQNNSGGYFIDNEHVTHDVYIEANSPSEASQKADEIFEPYSEYCECCGERWWTDVSDCDGFDKPTCYGEEAIKAVGNKYRQKYILYYLNGEVEHLSYLPED